MNKLVAAICVLLLVKVIANTWLLRTISYDTIPKVGVTFDEFFYAWIGKSLWETGIPTAWSTNLASYKYVAGYKPGITIETITVDYGLGDRQIDMITPNLDHPPLAGLIYSLGVPKDVKSLTEINASQFRLPTRYLSVTTVGLIFVLGSLIVSPITGVIAAIVYAVLPSAVFSGRLAMAENVVLPLFLASMFFLLWAHKRGKIYWYMLAGGLAGLAVLAKVSGVSAILAGVLVGIQLKVSKKQLAAFVFTALVVASLYIWYGTFIHPDMFWKIISSQGARGSWGLVNLYQGMGRLFFAGFPLDGWWVGGWLVLAYLAKDLKGRLLTIMAVSFALTTVWLGGDNNAWYLFPMGGFMALGYALLFWEIINKPDVINIGLLYLFPFLSSFYWGYIKFHPDVNFTNPIRMFGLIFLTFGLLGPSLMKYKLGKFAWVMIMIIILQRLYVWNFRSIYFILENWGKLNFPLMWN